MTMTDYTNAAHPLWATVRFVVLVIAVTLLLYNNADNFDETEIKTIIEIAVISGGWEGIQTYLGRNRK